MKDLNITKSEYKKILRNRCESSKRSTSNNDILNYDDLTKAILNALAKDTHKKKLVTLHQELYKINIYKDIFIMLMN